MRWVTSAPSVMSVHVGTSGRRRLRLDRFGRKAVREILAAAASSAGRTLVIDLRGNAGGDFDRMLRVAALFTGPVADAVRLTGPRGASTRSLPAGERVRGHDHLEIVVGPGTASSAEVLAALLRVHAGARIVGRRSYGKTRLTRVVPVTHDWRLLVAAERIEAPGTRIAGGIRPDAPLND